MNLTKQEDSRHENDPPRFPQALLCRCRRLRRHAAAGPESRCGFCHPDPAGRSLSLRLPAGARGRHQDRLHQHEDRFRQPRPRQPVHPRPEAAGRFQPHGRQPQCGHHLHAGVAGRQRRASNLRRAGGRPLFQRAGTGRMDEHRRRAGSTRGLRHRLLELGGHAARGRPAHRHSHPDGLDHRPHHALRAGRPAERGGASGPDAADAPLGLPPPGWPLRRKGAILRRTISSRCKRYSP